MNRWLLVVSSFLLVLAALVQQIISNYRLNSTVNELHLQLQDLSSQLNTTQALLHPYASIEAPPVLSPPFPCPRCGAQPDPQKTESPIGHCHRCHKKVHRQLIQKNRDAWVAKDDDGCRNPANVIVSDRDFKDGRSRRLRDRDARRGAASLSKCGFLYLERFFEAKGVNIIRKEFEKLLTDPTYKQNFNVPVAGVGREEYMLPFQPPFNESINPVFHEGLRDIILRFLGGEHMKLHLLTVVVSHPQSREQGWHQDWRYLFSPDATDQSYGVQVGIPLTDWTDDMGPTQICPGHNKRFYKGKPCASPLAAASSVGDGAVWDYRVLHRGPANNHLTRPRAMILAAYTRTFFVNADAYVNRGVSLLQTLHQRRFWEMSYWHPDHSGDYFKKDHSKKKDVRSNIESN